MKLRWQSLAHQWIVCQEEGLVLAREELYNGRRRCLLNAGEQTNYSREPKNLGGRTPLAGTGGGRVVQRRKQTCPQFSQTSLAGNSSIYCPWFHLNRFVEHPFPLCRKPEELLASCYTQHFTFWNGSGDPGEPTQAYESFFIPTMSHRKPVILLCSSILPRSWVKMLHTRWHNCACQPGMPSGTLLCSLEQVIP